MFQKVEKFSHGAFFISRITKRLDLANVLGRTWKDVSSDDSLSCGCQRLQ